MNPVPRTRQRGTLQRRVRSLGLGALASLLLVVFGFVIWANSPYQADREATLKVFRDGNIVVEAVDEGILMTFVADSVDLPEESVGLVFVPGARVDPYAYLYQLSGIVEQHGVTVLITEPTLNLAFFDTRELDEFSVAAPGVDRWFLGGHSLGGVRACLMAPDSDAEGLVLLGSYCANDLSGGELPVLSLAAENDGLTSLETITDAADLLPRDARFEVIQGANHAAFGDYGAQSGDGQREITSPQMRQRLTALLAEFLLD